MGCGQDLHPPRKVDRGVQGKIEFLKGTALKLTENEVVLFITGQKK